MVDKAFWVIETARKTYWDGHRTGVGAQFTEKIEGAIMFADFGSAEVARCWLLDPIYHTLRSVEHVMIDKDSGHA